MRVYHVEFVWYRLYDMISQSGKNGHTLTGDESFQDTDKDLQASEKALPLF
jgi:hypothetical protein